MSTYETVLDTLKLDVSGKIFLKKHHIDRTHEAFAFNQIAVSKNEITEAYQSIETELASKIKPNQIARLLFKATPHLNYSFEIIEKSVYPEKPKLQLIRHHVVPSGLGLQSFKWAQRQNWENLLALKNPFADDIVVMNDQGQLTETSRCNLFFFHLTQDHVITPTLQSGCLNGVYRRFILEQGCINLPDQGSKKIFEADIMEKDLSGYNVYVGNSIREILPAQWL